MKKAPTLSKASGADGEQLSFLPLPPFSPISPPSNSKAAHALADLSKGSVTQLDWLKSGHGWRLSAAVKELGYLGWQPKSILVQVEGWLKPIARYSLTQEAMQAARATLRARGQA